MAKNEFIREKPKAANNSDAIFGVFHKAFPLFIILASFSVASTMFASAYPDFASTTPVFYWGNAPVYWPWQYIIWYAQLYSFESVKDDVYTIFEPSSVAIVVGAGLAIVMYFVLSYMRGLQHRFDPLYGTARWATLKDLRRLGLNADSGVVLGQQKSAKIKVDASTGNVQYKLLKAAPIVAHAGAVHTLMVAPSRSGKGVSTVIPTLCSWQGSVICFDPKGENYSITGGFRSKFSHVLRFSPTDPDHSIRFNPLQEIRKGALAFRDASNIAEILVTPSGGEGAKEGSAESHFTERAKQLLTGAILHVLTAPHRTDKSLGGVLSFLSSTPMESEDGESDNGAGLLREMLETTHEDPHIEEHIRNIAATNLMTPDRERGSIFSTITKALWLFEDPLVRGCTSEHELAIQDFMDAEYPISLYLTVPYSDVDKLSPIIRLIVSFFVRRFSEGETKHGEQSLAFRTLMCLDEFPVLGTFPFLEKTLGILAGYGLTFLIIVQSLTQLQKLYGEKNPFMEHCKIWITYAPGDLASAKAFSEIVGKETVRKEQISTSGSKFELGMKNMNISGDLISRDLVNPDEIMKLDPDSLIIFCHGMPPYLGKKAVYYNDRRFTSIVNLPVPTTREEIVAELPHLGKTVDTWISPAGSVNPLILHKVASNLADPGFLHDRDIPPDLLMRADMGQAVNNPTRPMGVNTDGMVFPDPPVEYDPERIIHIESEAVEDSKAETPVDDEIESEEEKHLAL